MYHIFGNFRIDLHFVVTFISQNNNTQKLYPVFFVKRNLIHKKITDANEKGYFTFPYFRIFCET